MARQFYERGEVPYLYIDRLGNLAIGKGFVLYALSELVETEFLAHHISRYPDVLDHDVPVGDVAEEMNDQKINQYLDHPDIIKICNLLTSLPFYEGAFAGFHSRDKMMFAVFPMSKGRLVEMLKEQFSYLIKEAIIIRARLHHDKKSYCRIPDMELWNHALPDETRFELVLLKKHIDTIGAVCHTSTEEEDAIIEQKTTALKKGEIEGCNFLSFLSARKFRQSGRKRAFVTDIHHIERAIGEIDLNANKMFITPEQGDKLAEFLGLDYKEVRFGGTLSIIHNVHERDPKNVKATQGNHKYRGDGKGLPGGGAELTIHPIPIPATDPLVHQIEIRIDVLNELEHLKMIRDALKLQSL
ncbi:MAG: hypothetical protein KDK71_08990 [Chlamydiia bacterium]|nr:hypothetical protein [Chlamydiia bacterium]